MRAVIATSTLFTFGLRIELGFALDAFRCISILATGSMLWNGFGRTGRSFASRILFAWMPFIVYSFLITAYGTTLISEDFAGYGDSIFRSASVRPYINLLTRLTIIPVAWTIFAGLKSQSDVRFFLSGWYYCAIGSCLLGLVQLVTFMAGHPLFGILREEGSMPVLPFAGLDWLRICGFAGEPKHLGDVLFVTLILHLTFGRKLKIDQTNRVLSSVMPSSIFGLICSASSGAMAALAIYFLTLGFLTPGRARMMSVTFTLALLAFCGTDTFAEIYYLRFERLEQLYDHSKSLASGDVYDSRIRDDKEKASLAYALQNPGSMILGQGVGVSPYLYNHLVAKRFRGKFTEPNNGLILSLQAVGLVGLLILFFGNRKLIAGAFVRDDLRYECKVFTLAFLLMMAIHQHFMMFSPVVALLTATGWRKSTIASLRIHPAISSKNVGVDSPQRRTAA